MRFRLSFFLLLGACATSVAPCPVPDASGPCPARLHDEGDACVGWRELPQPPCEPLALVRAGDALGIRCESEQWLLGDAGRWEPSSDAAIDLQPESDGPSTAPSPLLVVTLANGARVATHGDFYAHPAAWRTHPDGTWQSTLAPASAFLTLGAALSDDEALFVGRDARVLTVWRR